MATTQLPAGYRESGRIDLMKKIPAILLNFGGIVIAVAMIWFGTLIRPLYIGFDSIVLTWIVVGLMLAGIPLFFVTHELIHGVTMKYYGGKPKYGFTGLYAYCGCEIAYFDKREYAVINWAPVVLIGVILLVLNIALPNLFWVIYFFQVLNISSAAGDYYMSYCMHKQPDDVLVIDTGLNMVCYSRG